MKFSFLRVTPLAAIATVSAALGLGRELVVARSLGLTQRNDMLQLLLSVTFTISLLGEAVRNAVLGIMARERRGAPKWWILSAGSVSAAAVCIAFRSTLIRGPISAMLLAAVTGVLNLLVVADLTVLQRAGLALRAQLIAALPNVWLALSIPIAIWLSDDLRAILGCFLVAPCMQLAVARLPQNGLRTAQEGALNRRDVRIVGWSVGGALAQQGAQFLLRRLIVMQGEGVMSLVGPALRLYDSLRSIVVDTYVASRLSAWVAGKASGGVVALRSRTVVMYLFCGAMLTLLSLLPDTNPMSIGLAALIALAVSAPLNGVARAVSGFYLARNSNGDVQRMLALVEIGTVSTLLAFTELGWSVPLAIVVAYQLRPAAQWVALRSFSNQ